MALIPSIPDLNIVAIQAQNLLRDGEINEALALLENVISQAREHPAIFPLLGAAYTRLGQKENAIAAFLAGVIQNPQSPSHFFNLGLACRSQKLLLEAVEAFGQALRLNPGYEAAKVALGEVNLEREQLVALWLKRFQTARNSGNAAEIEKCCLAILALQPEHLAANNFRAEALEKMGESMAAYEISFAMAKRYPNASVFQTRCQRLDFEVGPMFRGRKYTQLAARKIKIGDYAGAENAAQSACTQCSELSEAWFLRGLISEKQKDIPLATKYYARAVELSPQFKPALQGVWRMRRFDVAKRRKIAGDYLQKAAGLRKTGKISAALNCLDSAEQFLEGDPLFYVLRGQCYLDKNEYAIGIGWLEKALDCDGESRVALMALKMARIRYDQHLQSLVQTALEQGQSHLDRKAAATALLILVKGHAFLELRRSNAFHTLCFIRDKAILSDLLSKERAYANLTGRVYEAMGDFPNAIVVYKAAFQLQPRSGILQKLWREGRLRQQSEVKKHLSIAKSFQENKQYGSAIDEIALSLRADSQHLGALMAMGAALEGLRLFSEAIRFYTSAMRLYPNHDTVIGQRIAAAKDRSHKWAAALRTSNAARLQAAKNLPNGKHALQFLPS